MSPDVGPPTSHSAPLPEGFAPLDPADPVAIGPFDLVGRVGAGGMGTVYGALDREGRHVALKVVHPRHAADPVFREQFVQEAELLARVDADCAPAFLGADPHAERPWMATEFVPGRTLSGHVREHGTLTGDRLLSFAAGTAEALSAVHAAGIVRRDVKPANVVFAPAGPRLLDFGIARDTRDETAEAGVFGTAGWIAPERLEGIGADPRSDVFAWGGLVVYAATGHGPFGRGDTATLLARTREAEPDLEGVPEDLRALVARALDRDPERRPSAAEAFGTVLSLTGEPVLTREAARVRLRRLLTTAWTGFEAVRGAGPWVAAAGSVALLSGSSAAVAGGGAAASAAAAGGGTASGAAASAAGAGALAGMGKATAALVAVASTAAVATGGWVGGQLYSGEPVWPFGGGEASSEQVLEPEPERVGYRGMSLALPEGWTAEFVEEEFGVFSDPGPYTTEEWLVLYPGGQEACDGVEWSYTDGSVACRHIKVLGPEGIDHGGEGYATMRQSGAAGGVYSFNPSSNPMPCPEGVATSPGNPAASARWEREDRDAGGEVAAYAEGHSLCVDIGDEGSSGFLLHDQRLWLLEDREILIVDDYGIEEFDAVLAGARWTEAEEEATSTLEYRGMTVELPEGWEAVRQERTFRTDAGEEIDDEWFLVGTDPDSDCAFEDRTDCPYLEIAGPGAIAADGLTEDAMYYPGGGMELCTDSQAATATPPREERSLAPIGERMAYYRVWSVPCLTGIEPNAPTAYYEQRYWLLPESQILVVDNFRTEGLAEVLAAADLPA
ncbi:serine/threonine-protein kinase [Nocardiopsis sp. NRRL B-16309]|uniref:serine/threonine-protein kinase n=1 Tax=Nocardiopsis sp. NRRL B-16309 TaxID=1519494 RepID=UPI0006AE0014|nr:serine/threonine-protein kinase [Nocardiopsis sp. NRRL B-16309]